jgi:hypothetical protein
MSKLKTYYNLILTGITTSLLVSCGTTRRITYPKENTYSSTSSKKSGFTKEYPRSFTIYPFKNVSWNKNAGIRGRRSVFETFSLIGPCARMEETDKLATAPYTFDDAIKVARQQKSDAVVIGELMSQEQTFLLLYAYSYVELKISVYDTRNGRKLYTAKGWSMSNAFGSLVFWIPNPIIPMIENYYWSRITMDLYHRVTMDMLNDVRPDLLKYPK